MSKRVAIVTAAALAVVALVFVVLALHRASDLTEAVATTPPSFPPAASATGPVLASPVSSAPPVPVVTGISPSSGPLAGGMAVTIVGSGFTGATQIEFGSVAARSFAVVSNSQITAVAPAQPAGPQNIYIHGPAGGSATVPADLFTYVTQPAVTGVAPALGPTTGGTVVTITGSGFTNATDVDFGSVAARTFSVVSDTRITAVTPAQAAGTHNVAVHGPTGNSTITPADRFTYK